LEEIKRELKEKIGGNLGTTLGNELESAVEDLKSRAPTLNLEDRVNVYNWSWYIDPRLNSIFSDVTGCRVIYSTFETSDEVWA
ncbi:hypothetical protein GTO10_00265, partial [Candidatus Saccharibacteria bacterium]|nr:hypothetical protein [Candidatus Saccharibacteria bacterium]